MKVDSELWCDVNVVASLLKLFLRKLPRCLLSPGMLRCSSSLLQSLLLWCIVAITSIKGGYVFIQVCLFFC